MIGKETIYAFLDVTADPNLLEVKRHGEPLNLEPKALRVLFHLMQNRNRIVSKDELIEQFWAGVFASDNSLTRVIAQIRKQLGDNARSPQFIETISTNGYRFIAEVTEIQQIPRAPINRRRWLYSIASAAATIPVGAWWFSRPVIGPPVKIAGLRQLTKSMAADLWPSFSPDSSQLVFASNRSSSFQLYVRSRAPGSTDRQITFDDQEYIQPAWSPDGQYIAYVSRRRRGIFLIPASGGASRPLTEFGDSPAWAPDGESIVFRRFSLNLNPAIETTGVAGTTLWTVNLDGSPPAPLTQPNSPPGGHSDATWTADSRSILFTAGQRIWLLDVATKRTTAVGANSLPASSPRLAPDLSSLYFIASKGLSQGICQTPFDRTTPQRPAQVLMPSGAALPRDLSLSSDGRLLAFSQQIGDGAIWELKLKTDGTASGEPGPLLRDRSLRNSEPLFSPDGTRISYASLSQTGEVAIVVVRADGSSPMPITTPESNASRPNWLAPGVLGYRTPDKETFQYWAHPLAGGARRLELKLDLSQVDRLRCSKDGGKIACHQRSPEGHRILVEDFQTHTIHTITPANRSIGFPVWSPDGAWIAGQETTSGNSSLICVPSSGGSIESLPTNLDQNFVFDWSPDSDRILFAGLKDGVWDIYWISRETKRLHQLTHFTNKAGFVRYPSWSPQGDRIIFEYQHVWGNIFIANLES